MVGRPTPPAATPTTATGALFADPDPVPAVRELAETGTLASTPTTQLADGASDITDPV